MKLSEAGGIVLGSLIASLVTIISMHMSNAAQDKRDQDTRFRDERLRAYLAFFQAGRDLVETDERLGVSHWEKSDDLAEKALEERRRKLAYQEDELDLLAGSRVRDSAFQVVVVCHGVGQVVQTTTPGKDQILLQVGATRNRCWYALRNFQKLARKELDSLEEKI